MPTRYSLEIRDLHVSVDGKPIVKGLHLQIEPGQVHALMGPNGSGKTTLAFALAGHPHYTVDAGQAFLYGEDLLAMEADERARRGLFLSFQYPAEVSGVSVGNFLRTAVNARRKQQGLGDISLTEFRRLVKEKLALLEMDDSFLRRYLNEGFSGGEKKRHEILQMTLLQPVVAILDETDSGLDIDALRIVAQGVNSLRGPGFSALLITHYQRILKYLQPDVVHVMMDGRIVRTGGPELAARLEDRGYEWLREELTPAGNAPGDGTELTGQGQGAKEGEA
ncbi:MAG: Fe-S cluster assembly ATPase SufC [Limnochordaceae bacterium]|nr:Fe-S cluster assembly ATPase SufC [Limnochordaceae bacterium]